MNKKITETVYRPEYGRGEILNIFKGLYADLPQSVSLGYRLAQRNIKARYRQSIFGLLWMLLPPLATAGVWIFLNSQQVFEFEGMIIPYPVFVLIGTLLWQIFSESITILLNNIQGNRSLLTKINFPHEALILSALGEIAFAVLIKLGILIIALIAFQVAPSWQIIAAMGGVLALIILGISIGLLLLPLAMLYKDISYGLPLLLQFALYLTPVIYPEPQYSGLAKILEYNPVTPLLMNTRDWLTGLNPRVDYFFWVLGISILFFFVGILLYKLSMQIIIERIGS